MPRQNTGTYTQPANTAGGPAATTISSAAYNTLIADIGTELGNSLDRRGRGPMLAALNAGNFPINAIAAGTLPGDAARIADITGLTGIVQSGAPTLGTTGGTSDVVTATFTPTILALTGGLKVMVRASAANTTPVPTFKADGLAAAPIVKGLNAKLAVGDIGGTGHWLELLYDATYAAWILLNPALGSDPFLVGAIVPFAMSAVAGGNWFRCNGQLLSRTTYPALFAAIGTTFGAGDGSTTYALPAIGGYFLRALDETGLIDPSRTLGSTQLDGFENHVHVYNTLGITNGTSGTAYGSTYNAGGVQTSGATTGKPGTETRPKNVAFPFFIKA